MSDLHLYIGNKNLSSWSLRVWLLMRQAEISFTEHLIRLDEPATYETIKQQSPSGLVPCLHHGDIVIWDSLAISEYLNEIFPENHLWPASSAARALARAVSSEMHSGFSHLRKDWPMAFVQEGLSRQPSPGVTRDIERICTIWQNCLERFDADGPFLFGKFSIADAMYAPIISRFRTYGPLELPSPIRAYMDTIWSLPAMRAWGASATAETAL